MKKKYKIFAFISVVSVLLLDIFINKAYAIDGDSYTNYENYTKVWCGNLHGIPSALPKIISIVYLLIQILIPIVLVILGSIDLFKAVAASKEDEIKKAQGMFFKRLISAVLVFFVLAVVKIVIGLASDDKNKSQNIVDCIDCFIRDNDSCRPEY